ncbi:MAG: methenyltetrahydrofolate cyclohydrolase [Candidatus Scalindua sp. AMX11]|nr:MAG: methenyltetrahydrofolate cyclohydrolase [Candidatus Scalindua sp.]NOG84347.1 cyclodeaminase/cyclohydrolase family protein [Planctomycetota bacterium]RZV74428.1 MAG: methenyltetrahydrofolate cyclohydrolase [Candidatus Scalindua sp. SCAELEC01]TDE65348.1 MAG: methenyltetrahydrofolate cyclohydrolase [Candidatus Scalindua sp. AMX11]GJQ60827.1 MAG: methenyltetrahydrofolate cyclohydrolase [Candidatus Scalindua sp.]
MLADLTIKEFLKQTGSGSPVPGGGSVAALSAALAASLIEMVANLTIGRKGYEVVEEDMQVLAQETVRLRERLVSAIDNDSNAYGNVVSAMRLPKGTDEEKQQREKEIQNGLKQSAVIPMGVAEDAFRVMVLAGEVVVKGNRNTVSDGSVGVVMAKTAVLSALYNVKINLSSIKDKIFVDNMSRAMRELEKNTLDWEKGFGALGDFWT